MNRDGNTAGAAGITPFLAGGGELGALIRAFDWAATPLGPPETWPQSLRTSVRIMLTSRQPMWIGWGPELTYFYNDAYKSIIGGKHPIALGKPIAEVWQEIWADIRPLLDTALGGVEGTYVEAARLIMERNGYPEETYYTFSYSPIPNDDGSTGGIICANTEDTHRVIGERQLATLRDLASSIVDAKTTSEVYERAAQVLAGNPLDVPFALLYQLEPGLDRMTLVGAAGIEAGHAAAPVVIGTGPDAVWPFDPRGVTLVDALERRFGFDLPRGGWPIAPSHAAILPLLATGGSAPIGALVTGLSPFRRFDEGYSSFLSLAMGQIASALAGAQAYEEQRGRADALAEIDRAKTIFFSNVSHEFRTPLTLMLGPLEDLQSRIDGPERTELELIHRNGLRLLNLVNTLLDFSRIEAGRAQRNLEPTDLAAYTADLASIFRAAIERAGLALVLDCPPLPRPVAIDREMWEKIVLNLLSNAFKFTFGGSITVAIRDTGHGVAVTVADTGVGIPADALPHLFERFHRVEGTQGRTIEGSGIGLALVHELVKLHQGGIEVASRPGHGTSFTLSIPYGAAGEESTEAGATSLRARAFVEEALRWLPASGKGETALPGADEEARRDEQGGRVLIADDNADLRDYMTRLLTSAGYRVETAGDGEAALEAARREAPDLVLSDVMMPRLDGFALLAALRADLALREVPVLLLSARAGEEARVEGLAAGADDYLTKPFSARELLARVASNLALARLRRETNAQLRELNESLELRVAAALAERDRLWELSEDLLMISSFDKGPRRLSPSWSRLFGYSAEELTRRPAGSMIVAEDQEKLDAAIEGLRTSGRPKHVEVRVNTADGSKRWVAWTMSPDPGNQLFYGVGRDITADKEAAETLRQAEQALRLAQKMEAVGNLTGGVAHDFNNLLQVIGGNLQLLARDVTGSERAERRVKNALAGVERGSKLAAQLLAFGRRQPLAPKVVNLGRFIRAMDDMLRRALGDAVEIETVVAGGLWNTLVDPFQVENALLNLAINARDAMKGEGKLTIEAGNASLDDSYATRHSDVVPGQYVVVAVTDTGSGIPPEILDQVFEPFFTTKPDGRGTGLGLSMVYGFVKQSEGHVKIYSEPGHGTTVRLYLPRVREQEDVVGEIETGPVTGGIETILVVEDDDEVRNTVVEMLTDLGYRVLKARDAQAGLVIIESGVKIDLLFTDVVMPGPMRSPELARRARDRLPEIGVLFTSGYTENAIVHGGRLDEGTELLSKPYAKEALARKIRQVLRAGRGGKPADGRDEPSQIVLLVEDDELIRQATVEMLTNLGYLVRVAGTGAEAVAILAEQAVDLLLADIGLPDLPGSELAGRARILLPELKIVFATGMDGLADELDKGLGAGLLRKPYTQNDLDAALDGLLRGPV